MGWEVGSGSDIAAFLSGKGLWTRPRGKPFMSLGAKQQKVWDTRAHILSLPYGAYRFFACIFSLKEKNYATP